MTSGDGRLKVLVITSWFPSPGNPVQGVFVSEQVRIASRQFDVAVIAPTLRSLRTFVGRRDPVPPRADGVRVLRPSVLSPFPRRPAWVVEPYARAVGRAYDELERSWGRPTLSMLTLP